jgi:hypothetical protein
MNHTDVDNGTAAKRAMEYLEASMYKDKLPSMGLFYEQLVDRSRVLRALMTSPRLGDSLLKADGTPWLSDLMHQAPKINWDDLAQTAALPLGSWLKTDPWDDKVHMLTAKRYAPMNARDKMPFEVTPIFYKLQRYDAAAATPPAAAAPSSSDQPVAAPDNTPPAQPPAPPQSGAAPPPDQQPAPAAAQNPQS